MPYPYYSTSTYTNTQPIYSGKIILNFIGNIPKNEIDILNNTIFDFTPKIISFHTSFDEKCGFIPIKTIDNIINNKTKMDLEIIPDKPANSSINYKIIFKNIIFNDFDDDFLCFGYNREDIKKIHVNISYEKHIFLCNELDIQRYEREQKLNRILK